MENLFNRAISFAAEAHKDQFRKGGNIPYIVHPMEVAAMTATMTQDPEILAAAVLHDVIEDTEHTKEELEALFGKNVAEYVAGESENKRKDRPATETWHIRKAETLEHLAHGSRPEKMIALADKISNIRAMVWDYRVVGDHLWERFHQKDVNEHKWYYVTIACALSELSEFPAYTELVKLIEEMFGEGCVREALEHDR